MSVALVPQSPQLFYGTVLEYLRMARAGSSRSEVEEAARLAGVHDFVRRIQTTSSAPLVRGFRFACRGAGCRCDDAVAGGPRLDLRALA